MSLSKRPPYLSTSFGGLIALQDKEPKVELDRVPAESNASYEESIRILTKWLASQGWKVKWYSSGDYVDAASLPDRLVTISKKQVPRHRYYSLLHECAHVDLLACPLESRSGETYGYLDLWYGKVDERTLRHRVAVVIDEIKTWEHGVKLAKKVGLGVDEIKYRDFRNRNLKSYFAWALEREEEEQL